MLKELRLCMNHGRRVKRYKHVRFQEGLNVLIGPNGTGKSTILKSIMSCPDCRKIEDGPTDYRLLDAGMMSSKYPVHTPGDYTHMILRSRAMFSSHGQILQDMFRTLRIGPQTCLLLDEPESGQDFENLLLIRSSIKRVVSHGTQVICSTHQVLFWETGHIVELRRGYRERVMSEFRTIHCPDLSGPEEIGE